MAACFHCGAKVGEDAFDPAINDYACGKQECQEAAASRLDSEAGEADADDVSDLSADDSDEIDFDGET